MALTRNLAFRGVALASRPFWTALGLLALPAACGRVGYEPLTRIPILDGGPSEMDAPEGADTTGVDASTSPDGSIRPGELSVTPSSIDYGTLAPGVTTAVRPVTIANPTDSSRRIRTVRFRSLSSPDFSLDTEISHDTVLAPGEERVVQLRYRPMAEPTRDDTGTLEVEGTDGQIYSVALRGACPTCVDVTPDPGCTRERPHRLWPSAADTMICVDANAQPVPTIGPGAANYTFYSGCPTRLDFNVTAGREIAIEARGDGCMCPGCTLWHIHYQLFENIGAGLILPLSEISEPDEVPCRNAMQLTNTNLYTPRTNGLEMRSLPTANGQGFYYSLCSQ